MKKLVGKEEVDRVFKQGKKFHSDFFILYFAKNDSERPGYAIHVRKKLGIAVERNKIKRRFREALYRVKGLLNGYDIIILPREKIKNVTFHQMFQQMVQIFFDTGILQKR